MENKNNLLIDTSVITKFIIDIHLEGQEFKDIDETEVTLFLEKYLSLAKKHRKMLGCYMDGMIDMLSIQNKINFKEDDAE